MRVSDLSVGDLVRHADGTVCVVSKVEIGKGYACRTGNSQYLWDYNNKFVPIPLAEEVFIKNGFTKTEDDTVAFFRKSIPPYNICFRSENGCPILNIADVVDIDAEYSHIVLKDEVYNVHELQNVLRIFGLNEFADSIKID